MLKKRPMLEFLLEFLRERPRKMPHSRKRKNPEVLVIQGFPGGGDWRARTVDLMRVKHAL